MRHWAKWRAELDTAEEAGDEEQAHQHRTGSEGHDTPGRRPATEAELAAAAEADDLLDEERLEARMEHEERQVYFVTQQSGWSDAVCAAEHARMDLEDERARRRLRQDWWQESPGVSAYDIVEPEDRFEGCHGGGF